MPFSQPPSGDPALALFSARNDRLALTFLPSVGGRLLSIVADGVELLWQNPRFFDRDLRVRLPRSEWSILDGTFASWSNVGGSKTWPAPQGWAGEGEWPGPPDAVLDAGNWSIETASGTDNGPGGRPDDMTVVLTSPDDPRSGLRVERRVTLPANGSTFTQQTTFHNIGDRPVTWSIWEVAQVDTSGAHEDVTAAVEVDIDPGSESGRCTDLGSWRGTLAVPPAWDNRLVIPIQDTVAKLGFPSASGRIAYRSRGRSLALRFEPERGARYPDQASRAELWMQSPQEHPIDELSGLHPDASLVELEVLAPLVTIVPGGSSSSLLTWSVDPA